MLHLSAVVCYAKIKTEMKMLHKKTLTRVDCFWWPCAKAFCTKNNCVWTNWNGLEGEEDIDVVEHTSNQDGFAALEKALQYME